MLTRSPCFSGLREEGRGCGEDALRWEEERHGAAEAAGRAAEEALPRDARHLAGEARSECQVEGRSECFVEASIGDEPCIATTYITGTSLLCSSSTGVGQAKAVALTASRCGGREAMFADDLNVFK